MMGVWLLTRRIRAWHHAPLILPALQESHVHSQGSCSILHVSRLASDPANMGLRESKIKRLEFSVRMAACMTAVQDAEVKGVQGTLQMIIVQHMMNGRRP